MVRLSRRLAAGRRLHGRDSGVCPGQSRLNRGGIRSGVRAVSGNRPWQLRSDPRALTPTEQTVQHPTNPQRPCGWPRPCKGVLLELLVRQFAGHLHGTFGRSSAHEGSVRSRVQHHPTAQVRASRDVPRADEWRALTQNPALHRGLVTGCDRGRERGLIMATRGPAGSIL